MLEQNKIYNLDCMDFLEQITPVDAIITDPPYMINTKSDGTGKLNPWADYCNGAYWYAEWFKKAKRKLLPHGCMWVFLNWRSLATYQKAVCDAAWSIETLLVWDKCWIGPGGERGLRPSYELVALLAAPNFAIKDRGIPDIRREKWSSTKPNGHPAEKPVKLLEWLISISTPEGAMICDPFMGSGTTAEAAANTGRNIIGSELDAAWCDYSNERYQQAIAQTSILY